MWQWLKNLFTYKPKKITKVKDTSLIRRFEGLELHAYRDPVGVLTIGYGHTTNVRPGQVITESEAEELLRYDLSWVEDAINKSVTVDLNQNQFDALASWVYNLGETNLRNSTMLKKLNAGDYEGAADEMLRWNKAGGKVLRGLVRRRKAERDLFLRED